MHRRIRRNKYISLGICPILCLIIMQINQESSFLYCLCWNFDFDFDLVSNKKYRLWQVMFTVQCSKSACDIHMLQCSKSACDIRMLVFVVPSLLFYANLFWTTPLSETQHYLLTHTFTCYNFLNAVIHMFYLTNSNLRTERIQHFYCKLVLPHGA